MVPVLQEPGGSFAWSDCPCRLPISVADSRNPRYHRYLAGDGHEGLIPNEWATGFLAGAPTYTRTANLKCSGHFSDRGREVRADHGRVSVARRRPPRG